MEESNMNPHGVDWIKSNQEANERKLQELHEELRAQIHRPIEGVRPAHVCPTCHRCPTCGHHRGPFFFPPPHQPEAPPWQPLPHQPWPGTYTIC